MLLIIALSKIKKPLSLRFKGFFIFDNHAETLWVVIFKTFSQIERLIFVFLVLVQNKPSDHHRDLLPLLSP